MGKGLTIQREKKNALNEEKEISHGTITNQPGTMDVVSM